MSEFAENYYNVHGLVLYYTNINIKASNEAEAKEKAEKIADKYDRIPYIEDGKIKLNCHGVFADNVNEIATGQYEVRVALQYDGYWGIKSDEIAVYEEAEFDIYEVKTPFNIGKFEYGRSGIVGITLSKI